MVEHGRHDQSPTQATSVRNSRAGHHCRHFLHFGEEAQVKSFISAILVGISTAMASADAVALRWGPTDSDANVFVNSYPVLPSLSIALKPDSSTNSNADENFVAFDVQISGIDTVPADSEDFQGVYVLVSISDQSAFTLAENSFIPASPGIAGHYLVTEIEPVSTGSDSKLDPLERFYSGVVPTSLQFSNLNLNTVAFFALPSTGKVGEVVFKSRAGASTGTWEITARLAVEAACDDCWWESNLTTAYLTLAPVPEADTYFMLLVGGVLLGVARMRRRLVTT